jgi:hypothetical protein
VTLAPPSRWQQAARKVGFPNEEESSKRAAGKRQERGIFEGINHHQNNNCHQKKTISETPIEKKKK